MKLIVVVYLCVKNIAASTICKLALTVKFNKILKSFRFSVRAIVWSGMLVPSISILAIFCVRLPPSKQRCIHKDPKIIAAQKAAFKATLTTMPKKLHVGS
jgi:hypothetical protein